MIDHPVLILWLMFLVVNLARGFIRGTFNALVGKPKVDPESALAALCALPFELVLLWILAWTFVTVLG